MNKLQKTLLLELKVNHNFSKLSIVLDKEISEMINMIIPKMNLKIFHFIISIIFTGGNY